MTISRSPEAGARPAASREEAEMDRAVAVTGGLAVAGAAAGALACALAAAVVVVAMDGPRQLWRYPAPLVVGGMMGAAYGAFLGPLAAWLLMRHVPLGIAIGGTMLGTLAGGVAALALGTHILTLPLVGFAAAALLIRVLVPRPERARVEG